MKRGVALYKGRTIHEVIRYVGRQVIDPDSHLRLVEVTSRFRAVMSVKTEPQAPLSKQIATHITQMSLHLQFRGHKICRSRGQGILTGFPLIREIRGKFYNGKISGNFHWPGQWEPCEKGAEHHTCSVTSALLLVS